MNYLNFIKTISSFTCSSVFKTPIVYGLPPAIGIELTNHCNLYCPECPSGNGSMKREKGFMDPLLFQKIIGELQPYLFNANLYFQGEPMLHPEFFSIMENAAGLHTTVSTNGHFLSRDNCEKLAESGLNKLIISLDGFDEKTYRSYRIGGDFNKVIEGISNISDSVRKNHSPLKVVIQVLVNRYNENQVARIREFAAVKVVKLSLKSMQIYGDKEYWMPSSETFRRYRMIDGSYSIKGKMPEICARLWFNPVITWDGKVLPCCFDKDAEHVMGDINSDSFRNSWHGPVFKDFRKKLLTGERTEICGNCTSGLRGVRT